MVGVGIEGLIGADAEMVGDGVFLFGCCHSNRNLKLFFGGEDRGNGGDRKC